jgi:hypothetical protein
MKNLFDRLDVLGEDVKQKYIANLTNCNPPEDTRQQSSDRRLLQAIQYERGKASESITKKYLYER